MKHLLATLAILLAMAVPTLATTQRPDLLIINGGLYRLPVEAPGAGDQPLKWSWKDPRGELGLSFSSTACWRGYVAIWELQDDCLYLRGLDAWQDATGDKVNLKTIFPDGFKDGRVLADWFNGRLSATATDWRISAEIGKYDLPFAKGKLVPIAGRPRPSKDGKPIPQGPDILLLDSTVYYLPAEFSEKAFPRGSLWPDPQTRPRLSSRPGGERSEVYARGYSAIWEIHEGYLYMVALDAWTYGTKTDLRMIFPDRFKDGRVKADWFSGELSLVMHEFYFLLGEERRAEFSFSTITLQVKGGKVVSQQEQHAQEPNQPTRQTAEKE